MTDRQWLHETAQRWLDAYVDAWKAGTRDAAEALFSADVRYTPDPFAEPIIGRDAVAAWWLADPDEPGTFDAAYTVTSVDSERGIVAAEGRSTYYADRTQGEIIGVFANVFFLRFDADGRCTEYREIYALEDLAAEE